ncbi:MAG: 3-oxoacyl-ACP reductase [Planctomycetaceae bacterium]|nr:3-oxoacyl-ACP reductase [Planctomycetaceae bacterium]
MEIRCLFSFAVEKIWLRNGQLSIGRSIPIGKTVSSRSPSNLGFANLDGKTAVVTGSSSGIGRAIALELAVAGADVVIHARESIKDADEVKQRVEQLGRRSKCLLLDVSQSEEFPEFIDHAWSVWGKVDIWVNNAGVDLLTGEAAKLPYDQKLERLFEVDVRSTVLLSQLVAERMTDQSAGCILNIGWDQADRGMDGPSGELFATSKSAIMGFTRSLAVSVAPDVRVNCIAPGWIKTAWGETASGEWQDRVLRETPLARWGTPEDIAKLARFLCSDEASYITGQVINANGGAVR